MLLPAGLLPTENHIKLSPPTAAFAAATVEYQLVGGLVVPVLGVLGAEEDSLYTVIVPTPSSPSTPGSPSSPGSPSTPSAPIEPGTLPKCSAV